MLRPRRAVVAIPPAKVWLACAIEVHTPEASLRSSPHQIDHDVSIYLCINVSMYLCIYIIYLSIFPSIYLSIHPSIHPSIYLPGMYVLHPLPGSANTHIYTSDPSRFHGLCSNSYGTDEESICAGPSTPSRGDRLVARGVKILYVVN